MDAIKFLKSNCGFSCGDPDSEISRAWSEIEAMERNAELWQKHSPALQQMLAALDTLSPLVLTRLKLQEAAMNGANA